MAGWAVAQPSSTTNEQSPQVDEALPFIIATKSYLAGRPGGPHEINHSLSVILRTGAASGNMCAMPTKAKKATKSKIATKAKKVVVAKKVVKKGGAKKKAAPKAAMKSMRAGSMRGCGCC